MKLIKCIYMEVFRDRVSAPKTSDDNELQDALNKAVRHFGEE